ncbi:MAG: alpha/beta hydrolase [Patescibacteria group bacterium]
MEKEIVIDYQGAPLKIATKQRITTDEVFFFIHGLGCSKESFDDVWQAPEFIDRSVFTYDMPGFGLSEKPSALTYTMEEQATLAKLILQTIPTTKVHLVIHGMGGAIGLLLAEKLAEKLTTFISIEGNLISEDCGVFTREAARTSFEDFVKITFPTLKSGFSTSLNKGEQLFGRQINRASAQAFYKSAQSLLAWCTSGQLLTRFLELPQKKAYLYGEKSTQWADSGSILTPIFTEKKLPSASVKDAGHFVMNDNPQEVYKLIAQAVTVL